MPDAQPRLLPEDWPKLSDEEVRYFAERQKASDEYKRAFARLTPGQRFEETFYRDYPEFAYKPEYRPALRQMVESRKDKDKKVPLQVSDEEECVANNQEGIGKETAEVPDSVRQARRRGVYGGVDGWNWKEVEKKMPEKVKDIEGLDVSTRV